MRSKKSLWPFPVKLHLVPGDVVYHMDYPYKCGITAEVVEHHREHGLRLILKC